MWAHSKHATNLSFLLNSSHWIVHNERTSVENTFTVARWILRTGTEFFFRKWSWPWGATTAEKLRGTKVWAGCWVRPLWGSGVYPRKIFENSDARSCILVTTSVKLLAFWKLRPRSWGTNTLLVPNLIVGGPVSPGPYGCCAYVTSCQSKWSINFSMSSFMWTVKFVKK